MITGKKHYWNPLESSISNQLFIESFRGGTVMELDCYTMVLVTYTTVTCDIYM